MIGLDDVLLEVAKRFGDRLTAVEFRGLREALAVLDTDESPATVEADDPIVFPIHPIVRRGAQDSLDAVVRDFMTPFAGREEFADDQRFSIVRRLACGETTNALAAEHGVHPKTIRRMVSGGVLNLRRAAHPFVEPTLAQRANRDDVAARTLLEKNGTWKVSR